MSIDHLITVRADTRAAQRWVRWMRWLAPLVGTGRAERWAAEGAARRIRVLSVEKPANTTHTTITVNHDAYRMSDAERWARIVEAAQRGKPAPDDE